jgi:hypothetical protein
MTSWSHAEDSTPNCLACKRKATAETRSSVFDKKPL